MLRPSKNLGFTLIELMITVAIIGIISAIAIPAYTDYVVRGRIPQATNNLAAMTPKLEQYFQDNRTYVGACAAGTVAPLPVADNFTITCPTLTATTYVVVATGTGSMAGFIYNVNESNVKATTSVPTGWTTSATCWITKKGGVC